MKALEQPGDWTAYNLTQTARREPRRLVQELLSHAGDGHDRIALDLGFGAGVETEALLRHGWQVTAIDWDPAARDLLARRLAAELAERVTVLTCDFADIEALPAVHLVHASMALPFAGPHFHRLWKATLSALRPGGWIGCELFGARDSQAGLPGVATHSDAEISVLLAELTLVHFQTHERDGVSFSGPQHWHFHSLVGQRPPAGSAAVGRNQSRVSLR